MNENEHGVTPSGVTTITIEPPGQPGIQSRSGTWRVIIEQGNGNVIKMFELTENERIQLGLMLDSGPGRPPLLDSVSFLDFSR